MSAPLLYRLLNALRRCLEEYHAPDRSRCEAWLELGRRVQQERRQTGSRNLTVVRGQARREAA